jgi:hypothetical protein
MALARELRQALAGTITREQALARYRAFSHRHAFKYACMLNAQHLVGRTTASAALRWVIGAFSSPRLSHWTFNHYIGITPRPPLPAGTSGRARHVSSGVAAGQTARGSAGLGEAAK